jgi:hypothetical protein
VDRKWLVTERGVLHAAFADFDCREILAERSALITEPVVAREQAVRELGPSAVVLAGDGMQLFLIAYPDL